MTKSKKKFELRDIYREVADCLINQLEQGTVPWRMPWKGGVSAMRANGEPYRGINAIWLPWKAGVRGFTSPLWLTANQIRAWKGSWKGAKSEPVVKFKVIEKIDKDTGEKKKLSMLRYFNVYNLDETTGVELPDSIKEKLETKQIDFKPIEDAQEVMDLYFGQDGPDLESTTQAAWYSSARDVVNMPNPNSFNSEVEYYATLAHEAIHSTGHKSRLKRDMANVHGSHEYSFEELIAEFGANFVLGRIGIERPTENSAAYIKSWMKALDKNPKWPLLAMGKAAHAADWVFGEREEA